MGKLVEISAALFVVLFVMSLWLELEGASGSTEVELSTDCTSEYTQCIEQENTNDSVELGNDLTVNVTIRLPNSALSEVLSNGSKLAVVSIDLDIIRGRQLLDQDYMDRLKVNLSVESSQDDYGLLKLSLLLHRAEYADTRLLHVEIRTKDVLYKTKGKRWFHVPGSDIRDTQTAPSDMEASTSHGMDLGATTPTYRDHGNDTPKDNLIQCQCQCQCQPTAQIALLIIVIIILCRNCGFKPTMLFLKMVMRKLKWTWPWGDPNCSSVSPTLKWKGDELHLWIRRGSALTMQASSDKMHPFIEQESQQLILPARTTARPFITNKGQLEYTIQQNP